MAVAGKRPISPHLQVYKWGPHMLVSILHRLTGDGLGIGGALIFLGWLGSAAAGAEAYARFVDLATSIPGRIVLILLTWGVLQHAASGVRHLLLDTGAGYALPTNRSWSRVVAIAPAVMTALLWAFILWRPM